MDIEDLRRQYGLIDPASPDFKYESSQPLIFLRIGFLVMLPIGLYHFNKTVREWMDEQIATLRRIYEEKYPPKLKPHQKPRGGDNGASASATTSATAAASAAAPAKQSVLGLETAHAEAAPVASASKDTEADRLADALELSLLLQLSEQVAELIAVERSGERPAGLDQRIEAIGASIPANAELPATAAIRAVAALALNLQLPTLPSAPKWSTPAKTVEEARARLDAIAQFKNDYEIAAQRALVQLRRQLANELTPALRDVFERARAEFDRQLPERLARAKTATRNALESSSLVELAEVSRDITARKAAAWRDVLVSEVAKYRAHLEAETKKVLAAQEQRIAGEFEPSAAAQLKLLQRQQGEIAALEKELGRKKQIEKTGERVHALTSLLVKMEENLQRDTKAQLFDAAGRAVPQPTAPQWASDLQSDWSRMLALSTSDRSLNALVSRVPADVVSTTLSPSTLRHQFVGVEKAVRIATFLPPGEDLPNQETNLVADLYASAFAALSLKEGQALRVAQDDADRINNASFYVQKERNLAAAVRELEQLTSPKAQLEASEWIAQAKQRVQVEATVADIRRNIEATARTYAKNIK